MRCWLAARRGGGACGGGALGEGAPTAEQLDVVLLYLLRGKKALSARMEPLQVFTLLLNFLAGGGLTRGTLVLPPLGDDNDDDDDDDDGSGSGSGGDSDEGGDMGATAATKKKKAEGRFNAWGYPAGKPLTPAELADFGHHYEVRLLCLLSRLLPVSCWLAIGRPTALTALLAPYLHLSRPSGLPRWPLWTLACASMCSRPSAAAAPSSVSARPWHPSRGSG